MKITDSGFYKVHLASTFLLHSSFSTCLEGLRANGDIFRHWNHLTREVGRVHHDD